MSKQTKISQLHPLYLTNIVTDKNYELLVIPQIKNNVYRYHGDNLSEEKPSNFNLDIGKVQFSNKEMLNDIYGIHDWNDMQNFLMRNIQDNVQQTINRLFDFCWEVLFENFKTKINIILECYSLYFNKFKLNFSENKLSKILHNIKTKNNIENIHQFILKSK